MGCAGVAVAVGIGDTVVGPYGLPVAISHRDLDGSDGPAGIDRGKSHVMLAPATFDADGNPGAPRILIASEFRDWRPEVSPDGAWLSYSQSDSLGRMQVYVQPLAGGRKIQVSGGDGDYANILSRWSRAADEIYYRDGDQILVVRYSVVDDEFRPESPELLFDGTFEERGWPDWDVAPDGEAFALFQVEDEGPTTPSWDVQFDDVVFVFDWFEELRRRVPPTR